jgi:hypothetical protein
MCVHASKYMRVQIVSVRNVYESHHHLLAVKAHPVRAMLQLFIVLRRRDKIPFRMDACVYVLVCIVLVCMTWWFLWVFRWFVYAWNHSHTSCLCLYFHLGIRLPHIQIWVACITFSCVYIFSVLVCAQANIYPWKLSFSPTFSASSVLGFVLACMCVSDLFNYAKSFCSVSGSITRTVSVLFLDM